MPWWQAGAAAGGAIVGAFGKDDTHANDPVLSENRYITTAQNGVKDTQAAISGLQPQVYYPGSTVAGMNPTYDAALTGGATFVSPWGYGADLMRQSANAGTGSLNALNTGLDLANQIRTTPGGPFQYGQNVYNQTMNNLMPAMQGTYDAATRDNNRALNWSTLPGLNMAGVGAGQQGSSKLGQGSALATAATMDRNADIGASIYQNAVNQANQNAMVAGGQNLDANMGLLDAYGRYGSQGADLMKQAYEMGSRNIDTGLQVGGIRQNYDQSLTDADVARWNFNQQEPSDFLARKMELFNSGAMGSPGQRGTPSPSALERAWQGARAGIGFYQGGRDAGWWGGGSGGGSTDGYDEDGFWTDNSYKH